MDPEQAPVAIAIGSEGENMTRTIRRFGLGVGAATLAIALTASVASVFARPQNSSQDPGIGRQGPGGPGRGGPGGRGGRLGGPFGPGRQGGPMGGLLGPGGLERLGVSDAQREQVKAITESHDGEVKALNDRAFAAHQAVQLAVMADVFDEGAIRAKSADLAAVEADLAVSRGRIRSEVFQILTPEQRAKAKELPQRPDRRPPPPVQ